MVQTEPAISPVTSSRFKLVVDGFGEHPFAHLLNDKTPLRGIKMRFLTQFGDKSLNAVGPRKHIDTGIVDGIKTKKQSFA